MAQRIRMQLVVFAGLAFGVLLAAPATGAESGVKAGYLKCDVEGNISFIFGSSRDVTCTYTPDGSKRVDRYAGEIEQYGFDIGYRENGVLLWGVIAPTKDVGAGTLAGTYAGLSADVAAVYGVGANALIGGSSKSFVLQPLSVEGIEGLNIAGGVAVLKLRAQ
jgi:hypothetical protein